MRKKIRVLLLTLSVLLLTGCTKRETQTEQPMEVVESRETGAESGPLQSETEILTETAARYPVGRLGDEYILPDVQDHIYTAEELSQLTSGELRIARNEIYARHGRIFQSDDLKQYFSERGWYQGRVTVDDFDPDVLNQNEKDNLKILLKLEESVAVCMIPRIGTSEFPKIDGSTATLPISQAMYRLATGATQQEAEAAVVHGKTSYAWQSLTNQRSSDWPDLIIAYEPPESFDQMRRQTGQEIIARPIGRDALVFLANESNPVKSLTQQQIYEIYSGAITSWQAVGGKDSRIRAFQRPVNSGSQNLMDKLVMKGRKMADAPTDMVVSEMGELIERVSAFDGAGDALGYSVYYYAANMYQKPELSFIAVDGVMPSVDTIRDGSYPFVNSFYAAIRADEPKDSKAYQLFEWLTGEDGQSLINALGYVGISEAGKSLPEQLSVPQEAANGTIPLPEDYVILGSGQQLYGETGLAVFDNRMRLISFYSHIESEAVGTFLECHRDTVLNAWDTINETSGTFSIATGRWVGRIQEEAVSEYDLASSFAADHPELLVKHGVTEASVYMHVFGESWPPVMVIDDGRTEYYYSVYGRYLLEYDKNGSDNTNINGHNVRYVRLTDERTAYLWLSVGESDGAVEGTYRIYRDGVLIKELHDRGGYPAAVSSNFYARRNGNYLYVYNYQDELCARFLDGFYGDD